VKRTHLQLDLQRAARLARRQRLADEARWELERYQREHPAPPVAPPVEAPFYDEHGAQLQVGDLVRVRGPYHMSCGSTPAGIGVDAITGRVFRVVKLRRGKICPPSAALADPTLEGVDESDEEWDVNLQRLTRLEEARKK
jgi:hypothetical protein